MSPGKGNVVVGLLTIAAFIAVGFGLVYLRDFAPGKEAWVASYSTGKHFELRLAHAHGNLFAMLNVVIGLILMHFAIPAPQARWISGLGLAGLLMPLGILAEVLLGAPPIFVLLGGISMLAAVVWAAVGAWRAPASRA